MKECYKCKINETSKWYSGPLCRQCYRKQPHIKIKELASSRLSCAKYRKIHKEKLYKANKEWKELNKKYFLAYQKKYRQEHKKEKRAWEINARKNNLNKKLADNLRNRLNIALKKNIKTSSAVKDLGCSIEELKEYLESKFQPGMSWDNWSLDGWHIDHIRPLASFDLSDPEQQLKACHYSNLQPLWAKENLSKGDAYVI